MSVLYQEGDWYIEKYNYYHIIHRHRTSTKGLFSIDTLDCPNCGEKLPEHIKNIYTMIALKKPNVIHGLSAKDQT